MAQKINISGVAKWNCQACGCENAHNIDFIGSDGGNERTMKDGNTLLSYSCKCKNCGAILMSSYLFIGNITLEKYNELTGDNVDESIYNTESGAEYIGEVE